MALKVAGASYLDLIQSTPLCLAIQVLTIENNKKIVHLIWNFHIHFTFHLTSSLRMFYIIIGQLNPIFKFSGKHSLQPLVGLQESMKYPLNPPPPPYQDLCETWLSTLRSPDEKECLYKSLNRWTDSVRVKSFQLRLEREACLSACSCCSNTATHVLQKCDYPVLIFPHLSLACSPLLTHFLTPILPLIRPLAVTWNFWICSYLSFRSCNDKYPYCKAQCRMFQHTGGKDFRVLVCVQRHDCPSPPSWLRRWDHRQDVVLRA